MKIKNETNYNPPFSHADLRGSKINGTSLLVILIGTSLIFYLLSENKLTKS